MKSANLEEYLNIAIPMPTPPATNISPHEKPHPIANALSDITNKVPMAQNNISSAPINLIRNTINPR
jgi:hypothetical protein